MIISTGNDESWEVVAAPGGIKEGHKEKEGQKPEADGTAERPEGLRRVSAPETAEASGQEPAEAAWEDAADPEEEADAVTVPEPFAGLETEHCYIREIGVEDVDALFHLYSYPGITEFIEPLYDREAEIEYRQQYMDNIYHVYGFGIWGVFLKSTGELIGQNGIEYREDFTWDTADLGYVISPDYRRSGYCRETTVAVLDYARDHTALDYVQARIRDANKASIHICTSLGFIPTHRFSDDERVYIKPLHGGEVEDALTWREFLAVREAEG